MYRLNTALYVAEYEGGGEGVRESEGKRSVREGRERERESERRRE